MCIETKAPHTLSGSVRKRRGPLAPVFALAVMGHALPWNANLCQWMLKSQCQPEKEGKVGDIINNAPPRQRDLDVEQLKVARAVGAVFASAALLLMGNALRVYHGRTRSILRRDSVRGRAGGREEGGRKKESRPRGNETESEKGGD